MEIPKAQSHTPLMQQYWDIKAQHMDKILLFRMGDFYEMFFDDAIKAAPLLNIALTSRSKTQGQEVAMCGVPHHSIGPQINKLLAHGLKVAICDQIENASEKSKEAKIVKRAVTRVVTPGLVYDPETLNPSQSNFTAAVIKLGENSFNLAAVDATTGEIFIDNDLSRGELSSWIEKLQPQEFVVGSQDTLPFQTQKLMTLRSLKGLQSVSDFLLEYVRETQGEEIAKVIRNPQNLEKNFLKLSPQTLRHLEIFKRTDGEYDYSLCWAIDLTKTPMGARLLRKRLGTPFYNLDLIAQELDRVELGVKNSNLRDKIRVKLSPVGDLERKVARLSNPLCNARDLQALGKALSFVSEVFDDVEVQKIFPFDTSKARKVSFDIAFTLRDELPHSVKEGSLIREKVNSTLDEYVDLDTHAQQKLSELENREKTNSGITSLKIKYNSVFGYSFEVTKSNLDKVPSHFVRRQTMAQGERYITTDLSSLEQKILSAQQKRCDLEFQIFLDLKNKVTGDAINFLNLASQVASLDLSMSFAELAAQQNYCRPQFIKTGFELKTSRHPVLEKSLREPFIPNDLTLNESQCLLLTGPNMAGKSTLMRQVALISLLAHCGSFVPASEAKLPMLKQIFTRIGAQDNVSQGLSTFMVEMTETAEIIKAATQDSLVILDEIGRGTSTYDGMSLAQAVLEHFIKEVKSYTFFATHYHELTDLALERPQIINSHMTIKEHKGQLIFLRKLQKGPANRSYGIDVAKQAGLPESLTKHAQNILDGLVLHARDLKSRQLNLLDRMSSSVDEEARRDANEKECGLHRNDAARYRELFEKIKNLKLDSITPLEAMNNLSTFQSELRDS
jgi:DNA mismatch repair protein MutS